MSENIPSKEALELQMKVLAGTMAAENPPLGGCEAPPLLPRPFT